VRQRRSVKAWIKVREARRGQRRSCKGWATPMVAAQRLGNTGGGGAVAG
jgi:hypothetical protein